MITTPAFQTRLMTEQIAERLWRTTSTLIYSSAILNATVIIPTDTITDLSSVPRYLPLSWWLAGGVGYPAAVVHDELYHRHAVDGRMITRATADAVFLEALGVWGVWAWRRYPMWAGVRLFGFHAWSDGPRHFEMLNPLWTAQRRATGTFTPRRDVRVAS